MILIYNAAALLPWFWFVVAVVCVVIEIFTLGLTTIWAAISAVLLIFIALTPVSLVVQGLIFTLMTLFLLLFTAPLVRNKLHIGKEKTNAAGLVGKKILLQKGITAYEKGEAKINGIVWSVCSSDNTAIEAGTECSIEKIEGVTLVVKPQHKMQQL
ncbi:MAG: NfeD family protein [Treponema sp.]